VEAVVCELRRAHARWGALGIEHELQRSPKLLDGQVLPSRATINRILVRHRLVERGGAPAAQEAL
jgi:hypothetical protein